MKYLNMVLNSNHQKRKHQNSDKLLFHLWGITSDIYVPLSSRCSESFFLHLHRHLHIHEHVHSADANRYVNHIQYQYNT